MKIVDGFCLRQVMGETFIIPTGAAAAKLSGIVALNDTGEFLFRLLQSEQTPQTLLAAMPEEYDVEPQVAPDGEFQLIDSACGYVPQAMQPGKMPNRANRVEQGGT